MAPNGRTSAGFVLAGGKSSRMGKDKVFLEFRGQTLLDRALANIGQTCETVAIVGDPAKFSRYSSTYGSKNEHVVIGDIFPGCGPLGGIHSALVQSRADLNLMLAADMPFVSVELLSFLLKAAEKSDALVTVARVDNLLQPLCAIYRREFSPAAEAALREGKYKIGAVLREVTLRVIEESELSAAGISTREFFNVNIPEDLNVAEGRFS